MHRTRVNVLTYNRPKYLQRLLGDIKRDLPPNADVVVWDDASTEDYRAAVRQIKANGWTYVRAGENHGRVGHWRWIDRVFKANRSSGARYFFQLQDDVRLCRDFFRRTVAAWRRIDDPQKVGLNILFDNRRGRPQWTDIEPEDYGEFFRTGWLDGLFFAPRRYFEELGWAAIEPSWRWKSPGRGSGAYAAISHRLTQLGLRFYLPKKSLVAHVSGRSVMQDEIRQKQPLHAENFADGEDTLKRLMRAVDD